MLIEKFFFIINDIGHSRIMALKDRKCSGSHDSY